MKEKRNTNESSQIMAYASLLKEVEESKKKAKVFYISGSILVILSVFSFLLFGPVTVPVFSKLGEKILNRALVIEEKEEDKVEIKEEEIIEEQVVEQEVIEEQIAEEEVITTTTPKPISKPKLIEEPPKSLCSEETILKIKQEINIALDYLDYYEDLEGDYSNCYSKKIDCKQEYRAGCLPTMNPLRCEELAEQSCIVGYEICMDSYHFYSKKYLEWENYLSVWLLEASKCGI